MGWLRHILKTTKEIQERNRQAKKYTLRGVKNISKGRHSEEKGKK